MTFQKKFTAIVKKNNSLVCVGLDPEIDKLPVSIKNKKDAFFSFNKEIIDATHNLVCAYKPNIAFYEAYGLDALRQLKKTIEYLKKKHPHVPIVLDAKRGDVENTARMYAKAIYEYWDVDAATVYPHLGLDAILPYLAYKDRLTILLVKTSNPDSIMFQDLKVNNTPFYQQMAKKIKTWPYKNIGIMVGATYPAELKKVREILPESIFLSPGIGGQKAKLKKAVIAGIDKRRSGIMFNSSRGIIFASSGKDFAEAARSETVKLRDEINTLRKTV